MVLLWIGPASGVTSMALLLHCFGIFVITVRLTFLRSFPRGAPVLSLCCLYDIRICGGDLADNSCGVDHVAPIEDSSDQQGNQFTHECIIYLMNEVHVSMFSSDAAPAPKLTPDT